jgi:hypothetical protein
MVGVVSRWKMLETWDRELPGLTDEQLLARLRLARDFEQSSNKSPGRNPKGQARLAAAQGSGRGRHAGARVGVATGNDHRARQSAAS